MRSNHVPALVASLALSLLLLAGCAAKPFAVTFEPAGAPLTGKAAQQLASSFDIRSLANVKATDAPKLRETVLAELRSRGTVGSRAADLLTTGFPPKTAAVPVLVRICDVDGTPAVLAVEAFGDAGGTLTHRRLWVFDRSTGTILLAASYR